MFDSLYSQQNFSSTASLVDSNVKQWKATIISTFAHTVDHNWEREREREGKNVLTDIYRSQAEQEVESERERDRGRLQHTDTVSEERQTDRERQRVSEWVRVSAWERGRERQRERRGEFQINRFCDNNLSDKTPSPIQLSHTRNLNNTGRWQVSTDRASSGGYGSISTMHIMNIKNSLKLCLVFATVILSPAYVDSPTVSNTNLLTLAPNLIMETKCWCLCEAWCVH